MSENRDNTTENMTFTETENTPDIASDSSSGDVSGNTSVQKQAKHTIRLPKPERVRKKAAAEAENQFGVLTAMDKKLAKEEMAALEANTLAAKDPELMGKTRLQAKATQILTALLAATIGSVATVSIMLPNGLTYGGITGIARIIQNYTGWNYSLTYYALSMIITLIVWAGLGIKEVRKIVLMSLAYPAIMFLIEMTGITFVVEDKFLAAVFCGVVMGVSNGLTFKAGFSSGGTDSLAKVIKYKNLPHKSINDITFVINTLIVLISAVLLGLDVALYAIITIYVSTRIGEAVMYGLSTKLVELDIIPGDPEALTQYIMKELGRGVSSVEVTGEYTGDRRKQLKIICSPRESFLIKRHLAKNDPKSFVAVYSINSVWGTGRGFSDIHSME